MARQERRDQLELFPARKICSTCGEAKLLTDFHLKRNARDGLQRRCTSCDIAGAKRFHADNLEHCRRRIGAWIRKVNRENQRRAFEYLLERPCVDCGEADPIVLEFDHRADKHSGISQMLHWHVRRAVIAADREVRGSLRELPPPPACPGGGVVSSECDGGAGTPAVG